MKRLPAGVGNLLFLIPEIGFVFPVLKTSASQNQRQIPVGMGTGVAHAGTKQHHRIVQ